MPPVIVQTIILLTCSNIFMTFAWYAHLRNLQSKAWWIAALLSWGIALFEYVLYTQVPFKWTSSFPVKSTTWLMFICPSGPAAKWTNQPHHVHFPTSFIGKVSTLLAIIYHQWRSQFNAINRGKGFGLSL